LAIVATTWSSLLLRIGWLAWRRWDPDQLRTVGGSGRVGMVGGDGGWAAMAVEPNPRKRRRWFHGL
jgi:hypothetical protein